MSHAAQTGLRPVSVPSSVDVAPPGKPLGTATATRRAGASDVLLVGNEGHLEPSGLKVPGSHKGTDQTMMNVSIRPEQANDLEAIRSVNLAAFPGDSEAKLVDALRAAGKATVSLVAEQNARVIGHILFSPVTIASHAGPHPILGLAPMAVLPAVQRRGVGSLLVTTGLAYCRQANVGVVVVVGHADYYPRFGFQPASRFGVSCEYEVPDDSFMLLELARGASDGLSGLARYQPEFAEL